MKRTGATILSLALAMILVSSLGNGVSYVHGKKDRNRQVVILDCAVTTEGGMTVIAYDKSSSVDINLALEDDHLDVSCAENVAHLLDNKFKKEAVTFVTGTNPERAGSTRFIFVKK